MACTVCQRRAALVAALAPAISRLSLKHDGLLALLGLPNEQMLRAARVGDPSALLRGLEPALPTKRVPTALCRHDPDYPEALAQLPSAPAVLYATCTTERLRELLTRPTVTIAGSRDHTCYARQMTSALARDLASAGLTVISGVNGGLEGIAHHGVLRDGGGTIAVMACSPEFSHLTRHDHLHRGILAHGAAISEFPPGFFPALRWSYIASQRIIAALASTIVVIEAGNQSNAVFAAQIAAELGHDIAVVPGRVTDLGGRRTFALLRDGAHPVACAQDVLDLVYRHGLQGVAA
jgi:DNA processing protein